MEFIASNFLKKISGFKLLIKFPIFNWVTDVTDELKKDFITKYLLI